MTRILSVRGDMVDAIAWANGLTEAAAHDILDTHRGLAALGPVLPARVAIDLPEAPAEPEIVPRRLAGAL